MAPEPIAIIGSGCRFPGEASTPSKLWELLSQPRDVLRKIDRYNYKAFYHPVGSHHGTTNVQDAYLLSEDHRLFDAQFFNIKPVEADAIDPMQRILLETVYESLENAGVTIESLQGSDTAFYVGVMAVEYLEHLLRDVNALPTYFATGTSRAIVSNRISYFFDWHGPSMTIDTACSSSMIALHQAVQTLRSGESRVAVAAGADLILGPEIFIGESKLNMLSPTGRSHMWDASADGYARGEGFASVVLKRLSTALEDGDHIECIIRETGTNQDGRTKGITMPNPLAQVSMIRQAYSRAGLDLSKKEDRPHYFEAHGTGTPAGDPLEAEAICKSFFGEDLQFDEKELLHVGSIKTVIGHTEGTAGLAGVLKASLAIQNKIIPPNLLFDHLSPTVAPFYNNLLIPTSPTPWPELPAGVPRRASVNSFGFGGSNSHAILESYDIPKIEETRTEVSVFTPFTFSATSEKSLAANMTAFSSHLKNNKSINLRDLAWTLQTRRSALPIKTTISALSVDDLISKLDAHLSEANKTIGLRSSLGSRRIFGVFTGQGAQWATMGKNLILASTYVRSLFDHLEKSLKDLPDGPDWRLTEELMASGKDSRLSEAALAQPLCTAVQIMLVDLLRSAGIRFSSVVGHSSGEIGAAYAAGFLSATDALKIAYYRGLHAKLAANANGMKGAMLAAGTSLEDAKELCDLPYFKGKISVAASNSSSSVTLSGDIDRIDQAKLVLEDEKKFARLLKVDTAYHSHHMIPPSAPYVKSLEQVAITVQQPDPDCIWYSSVRGGTKMGMTDDLKSVYWRDNMVSTVLFSQAVEAAMKEGPPYGVALEVGPHPALKGPASQTMQEISGTDTPYSGVLSRNTNDTVAFSDALGFLWTQLGPSAVDFTKFDRCVSGEAQPQAIIDLPSYCWEHDRVYYCDSRAARAYNERVDPPHELLGVVDEYSTEKELRWRNLLIPKEMPWIDGHQIQGQIVFPAAGYVSMAVEAGKVLAKENSIRLIEVQDLDIGRAITFDTDTTGVETLCTLTTTTTEDAKDIITADFMVYGCLNKQKGHLQLMASCRVEVILGEPSPDTLPSSGKPLPNMTDIDIDRFYANLAQFDFGYKGAFRQMSSLKRKLGFATGSIDRPANNGPASKLLVHPPTLDIAFHGVMATWFFPMDDRLWKVLLPRSVKRITINPALCDWNTEQAISQPWNSTLSHEKPGEIFGDVDIYDEHNRAFMQVEGLRLVALKGNTKTDDRKFYYKEVWSLGAPDAESVVGLGPATPEELDLALACERAAHFFSQELNKKMPVQEWKKFSPQYARLAKSMSNTLSLARSGKHTSFKKSWSNDTREDILALVDKYGDEIPDLKLMCVVSDYLATSIQGDDVIVEHMVKDNLLSKYYKSGLGFARYHQHLAQVAKQIAHRYPQMSILEIGAQEGQLTEHMLKALGEKFASYTYTDKSTASIESAQPLFKSYGSKISFKTLDIESSPSGQGFSSNTYDLIVASLAFQTTKDLEATLKNVRSLLTPGGYLLLADVTSTEATRFNFTLGALPDGMSSCLPTHKWNSILRRAGFSGIDTITPNKDTLVFPFSIIVSQAVDDRINYLRRPLLSLGSQFNLDDLLILGGCNLETSNFVEDFTGLMSQTCSQITTIDSIDDIDEEGIPPVNAIVSLADLDDPVFQNLTPSRWESMKRFFDQARNVLWITRGRKAENPYSAMSVGFWRSVAYELPHVKIQFLDISPSEKLPVHQIAELLLQFCALNTWEREDTLNDLMWTLEPELSLENGKLFIPRVVQQPAMNDRLNCSRRIIKKNDSPKHSTLVIEFHDGSYQIAKGAESPPSTASSDIIPVKVTHSSLSAIKVAANVNLFIGVGSNTKTGEQVLAFSETNGSIMYCSKDWVVPCNIPLGQEPEFLISTAGELAANALFASISKVATLAVREPTPLMASIFNRHASEQKIQFITSDLENQTPGYVYLHPRASNSEIKRVLRASPACFVDFSAEDSLGSRISALLAPTCKHESLSDLFSKEALLQSYSTPVNISELVNFCQPKVLSSVKESTTSVHEASLSEIANQSVLKYPYSVVNWNSTEEIPITIRAIDPKTLFSKDKSYFLVGLTGDVGRSICMWMAKNGAGTIIMTSRNPKVDPDWIKAVESTGCVVKVLAMDVTDRESVQSAYETCKKALPPIAGVANAAMLMRDGFFLDMSLENMEDSIKPKVDGTNNLNELFGNSPLDFFILFSSLACVIGNDGQSNYSAANMYMTAIAHQRKSRGLAGSVMDIGRVVGVGYLERGHQEVDKRLAKHGMMAVSETDLHHIFAEAIMAGRPDSDRNPELITGLAINRDKDAPVMTWHSNPRFSHLAVQEKGQATKNEGKKGNVAVKLQLQGATSKAEALDILQTCFALKMQIILQLPVDGVDKAVPLVELGVDSLVAVEVRSWFLKELSTDMPVLKVLGGASVADLCLLALDKLPETLLPNLGAKKEATPAKPAPAKTLADTPKPAKASAASTTSTPISNSPPPSSVTSRTKDGEDSNSSTSVSDAGDVEPSKPQLAIERTERLSSSQSRFWFLKLYVEDQTTFNVTFYHRLTGSLRIPDLERAVAAVGQKHEALRSSFVSGSQSVLETTKLHLERKSISSDEEAASEFEKMKKYVYKIEDGDTMRVLLLTKSSTSHFIIFGHHHIIMDGVSFQIFLADLETAYNRKPLLNKVLQYPDFAATQQDAIKNGAMDKQLEFWQSQYQEVPAVLPLFPMATTTRRPMEYYSLNTAITRLPTELATRIHAKGIENKTTNFHFYLATLKIMLFRFLETEDLVIGIADANRNASETIGSIGLFLNMLPLRFRLQPHQTFSQAVREARNTAFGALLNSQVPFDLLLDKLNVPRSASYNPFFQAFFDYRQGAKENPTFANCKLQVQGIESGKSAYDISLDITESSAGPLVILKTQDYLYSRSDTELLLNSYTNLLEAFAESDTGLSVEEPRLFKEVDVKQALEIGQGPIMESQWPETLPHRIDVITQQHQEKIAVKDGFGTVMTYKQLMERVNAISTALLAAAVTVGSKVAVFQEPTSDWICSMLAIMRVGAVYVPLDLKNPLPRLAANVKNCQATAILAHKETIQSAPALQAANAKILNVSELPFSSQEPVENLAKANSGAAILYTSGSTGVPKGMILSHLGLRNVIEGHAHAKTVHFGSETVLQQSAFSFDMSLHQIFICLSNGGTLYIVPKHLRGDSLEIAKLIEKENITYTKATPSEYSSWIRYGRSHLTSSPQWKIAFAGGEALTDDVLESFRSLRKPQLRLINAYGPAETSLTCTLAEISYNKPSAGPATLGRPMPNTALYIVDENLNHLPIGMCGEVAIGGAGPALGYIGEEKMTKEKFLPNPFASQHFISHGWTTMYRSGDKGQLQKDGSLQFHGRIGGDLQFKLRGLRIELKDIESTIVQESKGALVSAIVSVRGDPQFLVAHVVFSQQEAKPDQFLRTLLSKLPLPQYMIPVMAIPLDNLPLNSHGKVDRRGIKALPLPQRSEERLADLSETELRLKQVWDEVLSKEITSFYTFNRNTGFFAVGGNSMFLVELQSRIRTVFDVTLTLQDMFDNNTLGDMASKIETSVAVRVINWEEELSLASDAKSGLSQVEQTPVANENKVVLLTGATGFLGKRVLGFLLSDSNVRQIHCVAVRPKDDNSAAERLPASDKIVIHTGDFTAPLLGLSDTEFSALASSVDVIIHCGAKRAFWDNYHQLRKINVTSTQELVKLATPRRIPLHFVSSGGVLHLASDQGENNLQEASVAKFPPPTDGSDGYVATKWASELYLENAARQLGIPISIYRFLPGAEANSDMLAQVREDFLTVAKKIRILPSRDGMDGDFDLIPADSVAKEIEIVAASQRSETQPGVRFKAFSSDIKLKVRDSFDWVDDMKAENWETMPTLKWLGVIKKMGFGYLFASHDLTISRDDGNALASKR